MLLRKMNTQLNNLFDFKNKILFLIKANRLHSLWQQFYANELAANANVFGVYLNYDSDASGYYTVTMGIESSLAQT